MSSGQEVMVGVGQFGQEGQLPEELACPNGLHERQETEKTHNTLRISLSLSLSLSLSNTFQKKLHNKKKSKPPPPPPHTRNILFLSFSVILLYFYLFLCFIIYVKAEMVAKSEWSLLEIVVCGGVFQ